MEQSLAHIRDIERFFLKDVPDLIHKMHGSFQKLISQHHYMPLLHSHFLEYNYSVPGGKTAQAQAIQ